MADEFYALHITEKSNEILDAFMRNLTDEQKEGVLQALVWQLENLGAQNQTVDLLLNNGDTLCTSIYTPEKLIEMGSISFDEAGQLRNELCIDRDDMERELRNASFIAQQFENEIKENIADLNPDILEDNPDLSAESGKNKIIDINELLSDSFKSAGFSDKEIGKISKQLEKDRQKSLKNEVKELKSRVTELYKEIVQEDAIAARNGGFTPEFEQQRNEKAKQLAQLTHSYIDRKQALKSPKEKFGTWFKETTKSAAGLVNRTLGKVERGYDLLINNGINGLTKIRDTVKDANEKFKVQGDTAYTNIRADLMEIDKLVFATDYSINKSLKEATEHLVDSLEKVQSYGQNVKNAIANLGRALTGKEMVQPGQVDKEGITKPFRSLVEMFKERMDESLRFYESTKDEQINMLEQANDRRDSAGLDFSQSVNDRINDAMRRSVSNDSMFTSKEKKKTSRNDDEDERVR